MADKTSVVNLALQSFGSRTTVTALELVNNSSNEAIQANLVYDTTRDELLRMAPWDCALLYNTLNYITSSPGTPENSSPATSLWQRGQPAPPWAYEYQYPADCLKACWLIPQAENTTAPPISTAAVGFAPVGYVGMPVRFKVATDLFYSILSATVVSGGTGYSVGDIITLEQAPAGTAPVGAPARLLVLTAPAGVVATVQVLNEMINSTVVLGGSYFAIQSNPQAAESVAGVGGNPSNGSGATFNVTWSTQYAQRVILTNQEFAMMAYVKQITDPNLMDPLFIRGWADYLGARMCLALTGDKGLANISIGKANQSIVEARKADGNEGLTVNDVTPDWIRGRGIAYPPYGTTPWAGYDWGGLLPVWG